MLGSVQAELDGCPRSRRVVRRCGLERLVGALWSDLLRIALIRFNGWANDVECMPCSTCLLSPSPESKSTRAATNENLRRVGDAATCDGSCGIDPVLRFDRVGNQCPAAWYHAC